MTDREIAEAEKKLEPGEQMAVSCWRTQHDAYMRVAANVDGVLKRFDVSTALCTNTGPKSDEVVRQELIFYAGHKIKAFSQGTWASPGEKFDIPK
jgi:hypothetical protein